MGKLTQITRNRKVKKILAFILLFCLMFNLSEGYISYAAEASDVVTGECGDSVFYELNTETGVLRIYGVGAMDDYSNFVTQPPWRKEYGSIITKVQIEYGVTTIGGGAFFGSMYVGDANYEKLNSVEIASTVTDIGRSAFCGCRNLTEITIPDGVKVIEAGAFDGAGLTDVHWGNSIQAIGNAAFSATKFTDIKLPSQIQTIGNRAFSDCQNLKHVEIPDNCEVGWETFARCDALNDVVIGENCKIDGLAFARCSQLSQVALGEGSISVNSQGSGYGIFKDCIGLQSILLPDSWGFYDGNEDTYVYSGQFDGCTNLKHISFKPTNAKYVSIDDVVYSKDKKTLIYYPACLTAENYEIPESVTTIAPYTFENQEYLQHILFSPNINEIGWGAFWGCSKLNNVILAEGIVELTGSVFLSCTSLKSIVLPASLQSISMLSKDGSPSFDMKTLQSVYGEKNSYVEEWAGDKFHETIYCSFDANGGVVNTKKQAVIYGDKYWKLPNPTRDGYRFLGWYTEKVGGEEVYDDTIVSEETSYTLYAHWASDTIIKKPIEETIIILETTNYIYDGTEKKPSVSVQDGSVMLVDGKDYSITYSNNIDAGTATVTITGMGDYTGTISKNYKISAKSISEATVTLETTNYSYDGTAKQPLVTVEDGLTILVNGTHYIISYSNNVNVGTAAVTVTGKGNYTGTVTRTFAINAKIVDEKSFEWGKCNWSFDNSSRYFSNYDVNSDVMNKMEADFNLSNSDIVELKWNIANDNKSGFNGSCFGMTISEIMAYQGDLKLSRYGGYDIVNQNTNTSNMTSVINFIQELQSNSEMCQSIRQTPFLKGSYSQTEFISKLSDVAEDSNYLVKLSYKIVTRNTNNGATSSGYHAVLVYGIEQCNYYSSVTGKTYDRKVLIADPNYLSGNILNNNACLYFRSSDSSWIIPYWNKTYSNGNEQSCYWNVENGESTNNGGIRNIMRYESLNEEVDLMAEFNAGHYIAGLEIDNKSQNVSSVEKVENSGNPNIDYAGGFSEEIVRYDMDMDDSIYMTENDELYALWNPTSSYTLSYSKPSDYNLKMDYETIDYYADVTNSTYTLFKPSGSIALKGSDASYNIAMVTDDSDCVTDWYFIAISGSNVDDLVYTKVKNGYTLSASELKNVRVSATGENFAADTVFSTNYNEVFIYEIDKNTIGVAVDTDNNGSYETTINTTESLKPTEKPNFTKNPEPTDESNATNSPLKGIILRDSKNKVSYKVLTQGKTVALYKTENKKATKIVIPATVTINGMKYQVTAIADNAFNGCKKLKAVTIDKNIARIGRKAFYKCKKLKSITIKSKKLKGKSVGAQAFKGIHKGAVIKVPKKRKKAYRKWLKKRGITKKMKIK